MSHGLSAAALQQSVLWGALDSADRVGTTGHPARRYLVVTEVLMQASTGAGWQGTSRI